MVHDRLDTSPYVFQLVQLLLKMGMVLVLRFLMIYQKNTGKKNGCFEYFHCKIFQKGTPFVWKLTTFATFKDDI